MDSLLQIKDECSQCGELLQCELCKDGHGFHRERDRIAEMVQCQFEHAVKRNSKE